MKRAIKILLGVGVIALLAYFADLREVARTFLDLSWEAICGLLLISVVLIGVSAWKWKILLDHDQVRVPYAKLFKLYLIGYFINSFAPSYLGGDALRSWLIGKDIGQHRAAAATILERFSGLVAMVVLALLFVWTVEQAGLEIKLMVVVSAIGLVVISIMAASQPLLDKMQALVGRYALVEPVFVNVRKIQAGLKSIGKDRGKVAQAFVLSFVFHTFTVLNVVVAAHAVGWDSVPVMDVFVVLPLILLIGAVPLAPMGLGIQEGAFFFFLQAIGATAPQALALAIVLRAKAYILALVGGVLLILEKRASGIKQQ